MRTLYGVQVKLVAIAKRTFHGTHGPHLVIRASIAICAVKNSDRPVMITY
jgi:hypothetical protein